jgi:hypothetical protein
VTDSPLFISLKRAERSMVLSTDGAISPTGNTGGGGGRPGGGGGTVAAARPPQTNPVVWYCFTNCWSSVSVWIQDFTQSTWVLSLQKQTCKRQITVKNKVHKLCNIPLYAVTCQLYYEQNHSTRDKHTS